MIEKVIIQNYKTFQNFEIKFGNDLNIIVGDNETGKSTILEAINLALTKRLNGRFIENELSPFLFNLSTTQTYLTDLAKKKNPKLPTIFIELYFSENDEFQFLRGTNNSLNTNELGIRLEISFDEDFKPELQSLISEPEPIRHIPSEFYKVLWRTFGDRPLTKRNLPIGVSFIDATTIRLQSGTDYYLQEIINNGLDTNERVALAVEYRKLREKFASESSITSINQKMDTDKGSISEKELSIALDVSQKSKWEASLVPHLDDLPFHFSGRGEQNSLKIMLALKRKAEKTNIVLVEEPENHMSFSSMNQLLGRIANSSSGKQVIVATHSSFVLNKLGLANLILIANEKAVRLTKLKPDTQEYFKKLSGYDTLRLILAKKAILVEGPSDELLVQKAYIMNFGHPPIEDGVDIINVRGLSFPRFLEIAELLGLKVSIVTDNDGNFDANISEKYKDFDKSPGISVFADDNNYAPTLEPQIVNCNDLSTLNSIFGTSCNTEEEMSDYMKKDKVRSALILFETKTPFNIPTYIQDAIK